MDDSQAGDTNILPASKRKSVSTVQVGENHLHMMMTRAKSLFSNEYKSPAKVAVYAPGRVNLMGEHIDFLNHSVISIAVPLVTIIVGRRISGSKSTICTNCEDIYPRRITFKTHYPEFSGPKWTNYIKGVVAFYPKVNDYSFEAYIYSDIPINQGFGSSTALEVAMYLFLDALNEHKRFDDIDMALTCQKAELQFAKEPCGISDSLTILSAKKDHAVLIDLKNLTTTLLPLTNPDLVVVIITLGYKKNQFTHIEAVVRRELCETASNYLEKNLVEATETDIIDLEQYGIGNFAINVAKHTVGECRRIQDAAKSLRKKDYETFGLLMRTSHNSLSYYFDISTSELDWIVDLLKDVEGVHGSRLSGINGILVTLTDTRNVEEILELINLRHDDPVVYVCPAFDGADILENKYLNSNKKA